MSGPRFFFYGLGTSLVRFYEIDDNNSDIEFKIFRRFYIDRADLTDFKCCLISTLQS